MEERNGELWRRGMRGGKWNGGSEMEENGMRRGVEESEVEDRKGKDMLFRNWLGVPP